MNEAKGQGHIIHQAFNWCNSYLFHINRTNHSLDMVYSMNSVWPWKNKTHPKFEKKNLQNKKFTTEYLQNLIRYRNVSNISRTLVGN